MRRSNPAQHKLCGCVWCVPSDFVVANLKMKTLSNFQLWVITEVEYYNLMDEKTKSMEFHHFIVIEVARLTNWERRS